MSSVLDSLLGILKKKKTIGIVIAIILGLILTKIFISMYQEPIRQQQIESVAKTTYTNKQFESIQENDIEKLLKSKEQTIVGVIDPTDNKGYGKVKKMFNKKAPVKGLTDKVYIYQPIYDSNQLKKELKINDKNTFLVIEDSKEIGRYSFNDLSLGYEEIVEEVDTILNPKISRKAPVRVDLPEEEETEVLEDGATHTSEVTFE